MVLTAVACETPKRRAMSVGRASPASGQEVGDQLHVVFEQRGRLRRARLAEAARLRAFCGQLARMAVAPAFDRVRHVPRGSSPNGIGASPMLPGRIADNIILPLVSNCNQSYIM